MKTALFTGTFDPFTIGHADIVRRALALFDHIIIGVAVSELKHTKQEADQRLQTIKRLYDDNPAVEVVSYSDLTVDLAKRTNASCIIRGVRSVKDFEYERDQAEVNRQLGGIETLLLFADPQTAHISSTLVRELQFFGQDVSKYLP
ncbi:pantetheine-phosphate adenylyltransferase [Prevotella sp. Rep29]|jgi:pantetheine-phosphate adenylyltransferase|uniref:pantetheine-phosphate adenylyltransferase n=1 Tax=Prevotella sp. Rep29 TaxID=2691580 RepID=UPI001B64ED83|nr:pantetheine-phosphate adenylyltransferase [Prevotella sp. Rep29]MBP3835075.1 pantetheine-phosphate adenylyltransferase [Prevotella sp.]MBQ3623947.1 pantetheine-phosphate adenylyltransferase [Prevotella sp.]QYR09697.1 pantetheine-phosphate adenylyltransferase [Prevotella sp. Rep29]